MKNLYEQMSEQAINALVGLLGFDQQSAGFRNNLREIPAFPGEFTIGEALSAYIQLIASRLN